MKKLLTIFLVIIITISGLCSCTQTAGDIGSNWVSATDSAGSSENIENITDTPQVNQNSNATDMNETDKTTASNASDLHNRPTTDSKDVLSDLIVKFIDVGQADAAILSCGGQYLLIDGGNRADSDVLYTILKRDRISHLDYVISTHAHEDHCGGIPGALEACKSVGKVYSPVTEYDSKAFKNFVSSVETKNAKITVPKVGETFSIGDAKVTVIGPIKDYEETNNTSIVVKIVHGNNSFLFTGDMERDAEIDLLDSGVDVSADVLKVGHHGSSSSTSYRFLREVAPTYGVISVGKKNSYGHPHEEALSRLKDADVQVFRTDILGDIVCKSDGKEIVFEGVK